MYCNTQSKLISKPLTSSNIHTLVIKSLRGIIYNSYMLYSHKCDNSNSKPLLKLQSVCWVYKQMHFHPQVASMGLWCKDPFCFLFALLPLSACSTWTQGFNSTYHSSLEAIWVLLFIFMKTCKFELGSSRSPAPRHEF